MFRVRLYYVFTIIVIASGSIPKGYDEGGFSASITLKSFEQDFGLTESQWKGTASGLANRTANISSFGVLGAAFGSLIALALADRLGRLRCWRLFVLLWASGILMQVFSSGYLGLLLFARIWGGLGAGGLTVIAPLYLSELAPAKSRGMVVSIYMVILLSFLSLGFFVNYAASVTMPATSEQYRVVMAIPLVPVGIAFICSFFLSDTPRWLASKDQGEKALDILVRLRRSGRNNPSVIAEYDEILEQIHGSNQTLKNVPIMSILKEIATVSTYRERFLLGCTMQTVAQWSGGNGITYYIPKIFTYAGIVGNNTSLITSGAYGILKLVFTMMFTWFLIDRLGRRVLYMAQWKGSNNKSASDAAIASVFVYAVGWSIGLCTVQYLYGTEIYPTRIRGVCYATNMALHWFFQFAVVRVTANMFVSLGIWGAYVFWALVCAIGFVILGLWAPETKGVPMEKMDELFAGRWWMGWKAKRDLTDNVEMPTLKHGERET
ncbi:hypothetical protein BP5796_00935 [Coleophoma crateriformis]|uniref:Major facilitator superfamily (MFS) profile domain-containing protein n=1 Tax=Coleophoma crateriformis TaxID=565419 RepID=A0A3D8T9B6_9HELO|nr:hypothetical protein BP5796_00935 [Coleophoma crateriformis]